jgi:hypothetical protein
MEFQVGANWTFIRNLFIIAALIVIIAVVWKQLEGVRNQRERVNRAMLEEAARNEARAAAATKEIARQPKKPVAPEKPVPPPPPKVEPPPETPMESLERLRLDLVNGNRKEMPIGTIRRGEYDYFRVPKPMTWSDAAWYAERFGGHLAIPTSQEDISWYAQQAPANGGLWIGAGRSGRNDWSFVDGTLWKLPVPPRGTGTHVGVNDLGLVKGLDSKHVHPFLIQWHRDGANPASLAAALLAARESLGQANPIYPPGTEINEGRHYLFVARPLPWRDALELAEKSGGQLAVASDKAEADYLVQFASTLVAPDGIWVGGYQKGKDWTWVTGEPWLPLKWAEGSEKEASGLLLRPDKGWDAQSLGTLASGLIIEWSKEREISEAPSKGIPADGGSIETLTARAKELVVAADKKRAEQLAANARSFNWELDLWSRGLSKADQTLWQLHLAKLKVSVLNSRIPTAVPRESGIQLSAPMAKTLATFTQKQEQIDEAFLAGVNKLRTAYLAKVKDAAAAAERDGQRNLANSLRDAYKQASENEAWIRFFGIDPKPAGPTVQQE